MIHPRMRATNLLLGASLALVSPARSQTWFPIQADPRQKVALATKPKLFAFPFDRVRLGEGPVHPYLSSDSAWLLSLDPDKFMSPYLAAAGLPKIADNYIATGPATAGHYLSALSIGFATTGNQEFKKRVDHMVAEYARVQQTFGNGNFGDQPNAYWDAIASGKIDAQRYKFSLNGVGVPWYTYHKSLAGLLDAYLWTGNAQALEVAKGVGDWIDSKFAGLSETQFQTMLECEYGGMEEILENLYLLTGNVRYHRVGLRFRHQWVMDPVSKGVDNLTHLHSNTTLPKYLAAARRAETSADPGDWTAATTSWNSIYDGRTYSMGGTSSWESWQVEAGGFPLVDWGGDHRRGPETCISYNLLKMGMHLQSVDGTTWASQDMEHTFWNHILSAWNPDNHGMIYYTPVYPGENKGFHNRDDWFPCCKSTAMESHMRHAAFAWLHDGSNLFLEQFVASTLDWREKGFKIAMETRFPESDTITLVFSGSVPAAFSLNVRQPRWCASPTARVNGSPVALTQSATGHLSIARTWSDGDRVQVVLPQALRVEAKPDEQGLVSIFHGPILLAALVEPGRSAPSFAGDRRRPQDWVHPIPQTQDWWARATDGRIVTFRPFYRVREEKYSLYPPQFDASTSRPDVFEAEQALVKNARTYTQAQASAGGYVGGIDQDTSSVTFSVSHRGQASCTLVVAYANGTGGNSSHRLESSAGWTGMLTYPPTAGWGKFDSTRIEVPLADGQTQLRFAKSAGYAELDRIRLAGCGSGSHLPWTWEAEAASLQDVRVDASVSSASGGAAVGGIDLATSKIRFLDLSAPAPGNWRCRLRYSNGTSGNARWRLGIGGTEKIAVLPPTGGWSNYDTATVTLPLDSLPQILVVGRVDGWAQFDALQVVAREGTSGLLAAPRSGWSLDRAGNLRLPEGSNATRVDLRGLDGRILASSATILRDGQRVARIPCQGSGMALLVAIPREGSGQSIPVFRQGGSFLPF